MKHIKYIILLAFVALLVILDPTKTVLVLLFTSIWLCLYFLPSLIAYKRNRKNINAITILNLLLGWTIIGWIVALIWAVSEDK